MTIERIEKIVRSLILDRHRGNNGWQPIPLRRREFDDRAEVRGVTLRVFSIGFVDDKDVTDLRNNTLALLSNVKYVIQFQLSSQLQHGVKFIMSRILENLHAEEAA